MVFDYSWHVPSAERGAESETRSDTRVVESDVEHPLIPLNYCCSLYDFTRSLFMLPKLTKLELQIMETLWTQGACSVREIHEAFPVRGRPAFTTVQTTIYRLETKKAFVRVKRLINAIFFEAVI